MSNQADVVISRPLAEPSATLDKVREMLGDVAADIATGRVGREQAAPRLEFG